MKNRAFLLACLLGISQTTLILNNSITFNNSCLEQVKLHDLDAAVLRSLRVGNATEPRLLCIINTVEHHHQTRCQEIKRTWLRRCDSYLFLSNVTDSRMPSIRIEHPGPESHDNLWVKTRAIGVLLRRNYIYEQFDWVLRADDDSYVIIENLREYLLSEEIARFDPRYHKLILGHVFDEPTRNRWFIAGSAFVMSAAFINAFADLVRRGLCEPNTVTSADDYWLVKCMQDEYDVIPIDTRDKNGRHRFHPLSAGGIHTVHDWDPTAWYHKSHSYIRSGLDACSDRSISFHYVSSMIDYERILYDCRLKK
jgi:glycoprotein-N-acetylgalactosamine 3-beta-galactosyltransferase